MKLKTANELLEEYDNETHKFMCLSCSKDYNTCDKQCNIEQELTMQQANCPRKGVKKNV